MKMRNYFKFIWMFALMFSFVAVSCSSDDPVPANNGNGNGNGGEEPAEGIAGDMAKMEFKENTLYKVTGDIFVPEGASVTIPKGVTLEFQEGSAGEAWFLEVFGSLYILGEENARVTLTASDALINSSKNQGIGQLWGGVIGTITTGDLVIRYTDILHPGGAARQENAMA